jgi:hypothetical protein
MIEEGAENFQALVGRAARFEFQESHQTQSEPPAINFMNRKQSKKPVKHQKLRGIRNGHRKTRVPEVFWISPIFQRYVVLIVIIMVIMPVTAVSRPGGSRLSTWKWILYQIFSHST